MVEIVDELKAKLAEMDAKMEELRRAIGVLEAQKSAFETVIRVYDPGFELAAQPSKVSRSATRETASGRVTELLERGLPVNPGLLSPTCGCPKEREPHCDGSALSTRPGLRWRS